MLQLQPGISGNPLLAGPCRNNQDPCCACTTCPQVFCVYLSGSDAVGWHVLLILLYKINTASTTCIVCKWFQRIKWWRWEPGGERLNAVHAAQASRRAILNANYMASRLKDDYTVLFTGDNGTCAHEFIID